MADVIFCFFHNNYGIKKTYSLERTPSLNWKNPFLYSEQHQRVQILGGTESGR